MEDFPEKFSCKNRHIFSPKESKFFSKIVKIFRKNYQFFLEKSSACAVLNDSKEHLLQGKSRCLFTRSVEAEWKAWAAHFLSLKGCHCVLSIVNRIGVRDCECHVEILVEFSIQQRIYIKQKYRASRTHTKFDQKETKNGSQYTNDVKTSRPCLLTFINELPLVAKAKLYFYLLKLVSEGGHMLHYNHPF